MCLQNKILNPFCMLLLFVVLLWPNISNAIAAERVLKLSPGNQNYAAIGLGKNTVGYTPRHLGLSPLRSKDVTAGGFVSHSFNVPNSFVVYTANEIKNFLGRTNTNVSGNADNIISLSGNFANFKTAQESLNTSVESRLDGLLSLINSTSPKLNDADKEIIRELVKNELERRKVQQQEELVERISRRVVGLMDQRLGAMETKLNNLSARQSD